MLTGKLVYARGSGRNNLISVAQALKKREAYKYVDLVKYLFTLGEAYEFECALGDSVFDLCLPERKIMVEFDGVDHRATRQKQIDERKRQLAKSAGFTVHRVVVADAEPPYKPELLKQFTGPKESTP